MNAQMYGSWIQENGKPIRNSTAAIVTTNRANRRWRCPAGMVDTKTVSSVNEYGKYEVMGLDKID